MVIKGEIGNNNNNNKKKDPIQAGLHHLPVSDLHLPSAFCKKPEVLEVGSLVQLNCLSFPTAFNTCHVKRKLDSRMGAQDRPTREGCTAFSQRPYNVKAVCSDCIVLCPALRFVTCETLGLQGNRSTHVTSLACVSLIIQHYTHLT